MWEQSNMIKVGIGIFVIKDDKMLMLKRLKESSPVWGLPGGKLEEGETWEECASRELLEETGLNASKFKQISWANYFSKTGHQYITLFVKALDYSGEPVNLEPKSHSEVTWHSLFNIPKPTFAALDSTIKDKIVHIKELI